MGRRRFPISVAMIVRDEEAVLDRCLASLQGVVDEIVVIDTGSTDRTVEIARSYGATVGHFEWIDDFGAARAYSLEQTTHPWRLVLDADEWIVDPDAARELLDRVGAARPDFLGLVDMFQADEHGRLDRTLEPIELGRLLPRHVTYTGRVHEQPTPEIAAQRLHLLLGHSGYSADALAAKEGRNVALLTSAVAAEPANAYLWYQLGSEYSVRGRYEEALPHLVTAFNLTHPESSEGAAPPQRPWWHRLTLRLMIALTALGRHDESTAVGELEAGRWSASADFQVVYGQALRALAVSLPPEHGGVAEQLVLASLDLWRRAVELGDRAEYAGVLAQRASVTAALLAADDYETLGRADEAQRYRSLASA
ncbi:glycosyltransferase family 2 protein [Nocardioides sp. BP30]|uniref:glycosyltransferase family 2 protein n=1 Tax=Nocardioides sp. BP30 TaxID=3036374 RepID=UPI002468E43A|nr:glycosyltransferase family 2 protein [Nocardioides sp. BP30]WGL51906.1 glycosyltransferase family 2 protein [Nocardioides sp. BP30]